MRFLRCVGKAIVARGLRGFMGLVPFGEQLYDVSVDAIEWYRHDKQEDRIITDLEEVVQADGQTIRVEAVQIAQEVAVGRPPEEIAQLESYRSQVPGIARQSLRRQDDPSGTTVPNTLNLRDPVQLASVLPRKVPRFRGGDLVPHAPQWKLVEPLGCAGRRIHAMASTNRGSERTGTASNGELRFHSCAVHSRQCASQVSRQRANRRLHEQSRSAGKA